MNISIPPVGVGLIIIVISNCIITFGKSDIMNKCHILLSSILSILGVSGIIMIRSQFITRLYKAANTRDFDPDFVSRAVMKFDFFAVISIIITCLVIIILLYFLFANRKSKSGFVWNNLSLIVIAIMITLFYAGILYSFTTINKLFNIGAYIWNLYISEIFALYIPLVFRRVIMLKEGA